MMTPAAPRVLMAPSILSADFTRLAEAVRMMEEAGADWIHVDVMDGHFVPNLTIGPPVVKALKRITSLPLDVHLMISNPDETVVWYLEAGADSISVHVETCRDGHAVLREIRSAGRRCAITLNPTTPASAVQEYLNEVDMVLVMSVNPGFGGQRFIPESVEKVREIASMCAECGVRPLIEVDGGIDEATAPLVCAAGARVLVAGNAVFGRPDPGEALQAIRQAGESGLE
jgi:ribulose-phosphate 3-epimerase